MLLHPGNLPLALHTYGCIYAQENVDNKLKIIQLWDPYMTFAMLVERKRECQQFATSGNNPFTKPQLIHKMLQLIIQTGAFPHNIC